MTYEPLRQGVYAQKSDKSSGEVSFTLILSKKRLWQETWRVVVLAEFQSAGKIFVFTNGYDFDLKTENCDFEISINMRKKLTNPVVKSVFF